MSSRGFIGVAIGLTLAGTDGVSLKGAVEAADLEFFERRIRPVLVEHCQECHGASGKAPKGGLRVDSRMALLTGGDTGPAVVPNKPAESLLIAAITHAKKDLEMPPRKPRLPEVVIRDFEAWVARGAAWAGAVEAPEARASGLDIDARKHQLPWIWESPRRSPAPAVKDAAWADGAVDAFVRERLERGGLDPSPAAGRELWLRRVHLALVGLPPRLDQLDAFLADGRPDARERVVDGLLASPAFGERWARHWLDVVRYAESRGHEGDYVIPNAHEYRDYVVRALNADLPYDQFVREHVAGDLLPVPRLHPSLGFNESILATGWTFLGEEIHAPVDTRLDENERVDNRIDVLTKGFLGLTVSCARCHDHKFDAISQKDYYALAGYFISTGQRLARFETWQQDHAVAAQLEALRNRSAAVLAARLAESQAPVLGRLKDYLAAAIPAIPGGSLSNGGTRVRPSSLPPESLARLRREATDRGLDLRILEQWAAAMVSARDEPENPLHLLALAAPAGGRSGPLNPVPDKPLVPEGARLVADFGAMTNSAWRADGVVFGRGPARAGEPRVTPPHATNRARISIGTRAGAQSDPDWRGIELSPGVEREPTLYGQWKRDGAMLRSPKFELGTGRLHYLVRGSGRLVAAIDSQRLITGPVHTVQVREWPFKDRWHWISHDLSDYRGHRVAVEFSPGNDFDTGVALIIESETKPADPPSPAAHLARALVTCGGSSLDELVAGYHEVLNATASAFWARSADGPGCELAAWLASRPELFSGVDDQWPEPAETFLRGYLAEREAIVRQVKWAGRTAPAMLDGNGVDEYLLVRGKHTSPKGAVPRRFLEAFPGSQPVGDGTSSGRGTLAEQMTSPSNPLLARVIVNRVWHHLFGRGIVASVDNFGWLGQRPTHPELLDSLAVEFIEGDQWSLKRLIRRLVLSRTFGQTSRPGSDEVEQRDPENLLLHRMPLRRLEAEGIRDSMLAVSGRLDARMGGPGVPLHPSQFVEARGLRPERGSLDGDGRRSLYIAARRNFLPMMMTAFDLPTPFTTVGRRNVSNVPGQMLFLMNDPFVHDQARVWADRLLREAPGLDPAGRIRMLYRMAFTREPAAEELDRCLATLGDFKAAAVGADPERAAWTDLCHALFGVKEFIYVR